MNILVMNKKVDKIRNFTNKYLAKYKKECKIILKIGDIIMYNEEILEKCLPKYLEEDLKRLKEGMKNKVSYLDCLVNELQGSVNSAFVDGDITEEQCDYFYKKYIHGGIV